MQLDRGRLVWRESGTGACVVAGHDLILLVGETGMRDVAVILERYIRLAGQCRIGR